MTDLFRGRFRTRRALIGAALPLTVLLGPAARAEETEQQLEGSQSTGRIATQAYAEFPYMPET